MSESSIIEKLESFRKQLPEKPGVYQMFTGDNTLLYVGKAANLKKRVNSYFTKQHKNTRILKMVSQIGEVKTTITATEAEALLLESNLIKSLKPKYNILLRDDKSYPYIYVTTKATFPRLSFHRGSQQKTGRYFGPYPSAAAVRFTLNQLQKVFQIRLCEESYFSNRSRPCLQHQIKRCSAPCVGLIEPENYAADVSDSIRFLEGKSQEIIGERVQQMERASQALEFEAAATYRDQIELLRKISQQQDISGAKGDVDIVAAKLVAGKACIQVFFIRHGNSLGNRAFFPKLPDKEAEPAEVLAAFIAQYYSNREVPAQIIINEPLAEQSLFEEMLSLKAASRVTLHDSVRGKRARWLQMAERNALAALQSRAATQTNQKNRVDDLQKALNLEARPVRMECFDISHTSGEATTASCVVFEEGAPKTSEYRRFNIKGVTAGDDYAAMHQALTRRYTRLANGEAPMPDILFVDGGKGQLRQAREVFDELAIQGVTLVGVAKGEGRKSGLETLFTTSHPDGLTLAQNSTGFLLVQHIRDESHRFAITGHRTRRGKARTKSTLEEIQGLGPKRRQSLLKEFGGIKGIARASVEELQKISGISRKLALKVYDVYHHD